MCQALHLLLPHWILPAVLRDCKSHLRELRGRGSERCGNVSRVPGLEETQWGLSEVRSWGHQSRCSSMNIVLVELRLGLILCEREEKRKTEDKKKLFVIISSFVFQF